MQVVGENESYVTEFLLTGCTAQRKYKMVIAATLLIVYTVTVVGNGLIVFVILSNVQLQTPMYFFICNLSLVDMCLISTILPVSVANCLAERPITPFRICVTQIASTIFFGATECLLLTVMAYDRYIAISNPLHYVLVMNRTVCLRLVIMSWTTTLIAVIIPIVSVPLRLCEHFKVDNILCEFKAVFQLLCENADLYQLLIYAIAGYFLIAPLGFIIYSYIRIVVAILRMNSEENRMKAFSTCGSHVTVVILYFGTAMFGFLHPQSEELNTLRSKIAVSSAAIITPLCNPFIYTLKNKDILRALKRLIYRKGDV